MERSHWLVFATVLGLATTAAGQPHHHHPGAATAAPEAPPSGGGDSELISVPVPEVDGMLRRMRVYLLEPAADATGFGIGGMGAGHKVWALLPSCHPADPDDPRDPCPVERLTLDAVGEGTVAAQSPTGLTNAPDARRVQCFVVPPEVHRVRIRVLGTQNHVRYEAVVEAARIVDLPAPEGTPRPDGFDFDLTQYPAR